MIDVVIPLSKESKNNNKELRFCLRSLETNLRDLGRIILVTETTPEWIDSDKVIISYVPDTLQHNKDGNIINKVLLTIDAIPDLSEEFIFCSDDQVLLKSIGSNDIQVYFCNDIKNIKILDDPYHKRLKNDMDKLSSEGKSTLNYESHIPVVFHKELFKHIYRDLYPEYYDDTESGVGYTINTMYFNNIEQESTQMAIDKITLEKENRLSVEDILNTFDSKTWLGYSDKGFNSELQMALEIFFPNKSKYENDIYPTMFVTEPGKVTELNTKFYNSTIDSMLTIRVSLLSELDRIKESRKRLGYKNDDYQKNYSEYIQNILNQIEERFTIYDLRKFSEWQNLSNI